MTQIPNSVMTMDLNQFEFNGTGEAADQFMMIPGSDKFDWRADIGAPVVDECEANKEVYEQHQLQL